MRRLTLLPYALWAVLCTAYATLALARFHRLETPSWDNAIFEQAIRGYASLGAPIVDIKGPGYNILGDHFSPITALVAPFYRLFPDATTLLIVQAVLVSFSAVPITRLALARLGTASGITIAIAYGLSFGIASAVYVDFHEVAFAAPLLALAGAAYVNRRWTRVAVWSSLLIFVKEDMGLTIVAVGVVLALSGSRRVGALLAVGGLVGFVLVLTVIIPAFNPAGTYDYFGVLSGDRPGGPGPLTTFFTAWDTKILTVALTLGITGFMALRSPWVLVAGPTLLWRLVGDNDYYWGTDWHYSLVLMPVVFVAMIDAIVRLRADEHPGRIGRYAAHAPAIAGAVAVVLAMQYPLAQIFQPETYAASPRDTAANDVMELIPEGASVETDIGLMTHLTSDRTVYWTGTVGSAVPDYVLIDTQAGWSALPDVVSYAHERHPGAEYEQIFDRDGYLLARRER